MQNLEKAKIMMGKERERRERERERGERERKIQSRKKGWDERNHLGRGPVGDARGGGMYIVKIT